MNEMTDYNQNNPYVNSPYVNAGGALPLKAIISGYLVAVILSCLLMFGGAALLHWTGISDIISPVMVLGISILGLLAGSWLAGKKAGFRGWLNGGLVGFIYVASLMVMAAFTVEGFYLGLNVLSKLFVGFSIGALGGMWGVNS